jgi:hypothetical protein
MRELSSKHAQESVYLYITRGRRYSPVLTKTVPAVQLRLNCLASNIVIIGAEVLQLLFHANGRTDGRTDGRKEHLPQAFRRMQTSIKGH